MRFKFSGADRLDASPEFPAAPSPLRSSIALAASFGLLALGLGACADSRADPLFTGSMPADGYRTRHPIVLQESAETMDIPVGVQPAALTARMAHTVSVFGEQARRQGARSVTILVPAGSANEAAATRLAGEVATALAQGGVPRAAINRARYEVEDSRASAPLRVAYPRVKAMVTHRCGNWPDPLAVGNFENQEDYEFGCATQSNLAAMVANPSDLVTPAGEDPADGTRRTKIITKYREGTQTKAETGAKATAIADSVTGGN